MRNFLTFTLLISVHWHLFHFKCHGLIFAVLDVLQVRAMVLPYKYYSSLAAQECINRKT